MKPLLKIRILAVGLIVFFGLGTLLVVRSLFTGWSSPLAAFAIAANLGFVVSGVGLWRLARWGWWLTIVLCAVSIIQLLSRTFTTFTLESATKPAQVASYVVAGSYLGIAVLLTGESVRKTFRESRDHAA